MDESFFNHLSDDVQLKKKHYDWFCGNQETLLVIISVETVPLLDFYCENCDTFVFKILWIESSKEQLLFEMEIICSIIYNFAAASGQFNVSLLNTILYLFF